MTCMNWIRIALLVAVVFCLGTAGSAQTPVVSSYMPPEVTVGYLPTTNMPVQITMQNFQLGPASPASGFRAYWNVQGGTTLPIFGQPGSSMAGIEIPPNLRSTPGLNVVLVCNFVSVGQGQIESCTNPVASTLFVVNAPPAFTIAPTLPSGVQNSPYSIQLAVTGGTKGPPGSPYQFAADTESLPPGIFLNGQTGALFGTPTAVGSYTFLVSVSDAFGITAERTFMMTVRPPLTISTSAQLPPATVDVPYSTIFTAAGGVGPFIWTVAPGSLLPPGLMLNSSSGSLNGTPPQVGNFSFTIQVRDFPENITTRDFTLNVANPLLISTASPLPNGAEGVFYSQSFAASGGSGPFVWALAPGSALPSGLSLSQSQGELSGSPQQTGSFGFTIQVTDSLGRQASRSFVLTVGPGLTIVTGVQLPAGSLGTPYSLVLQATGGVPPYVWYTVDEVSMPPGLTLSQSGVISGTPAETGSFLIPIEVADAQENFRTRVFSINIALPLAITSSAQLPSGAEGAVYQTQLTATGGTPPFTWSVVPGSTLPPGLTLAPSTGVLSGILTQAGSFTFALRLTDSQNREANRTFSLAVSAGLTITTSPQLPAATAGSVYAATFVATGGTTPYLWSVAPGSSLPPGLALDANSGLLSGTPPQQGLFAFTIRVTDAQQATNTRAFSLDVGLPLTFVTGSQLPSGSVGAVYSQVIAATGGASPFVFSTEPAALPPGLILDASSGLLSGIPESTGEFSFSVTVRDARQIVTSRTFVLAVTSSAPPNLITETLPDGLRDRPYTGTLQVVGGSGSLTFSVVAGELPSGLTGPDASGVIAGVPTQDGLFSFTVRVRDSQQRTAERAYTLRIQADLQFRTGAVLPGATVGAPVNLAIEVDGGTAPYTFAIAEGGTPLPEGLALSSAGTLSGTPQSPFLGAVLIRVTDSAEQPASISRAFQWRIAVPPIITTATLPNAVQGQSYSQVVQVDGGVPAYTFALTAGSLPIGLVLNQNGTISGVSTALGESTFTIRATDVDGRVAERPFIVNTVPRTVSGVTIDPGSPNPPPNTQQAVQVSLEETEDEDLEGILTITFLPTANPPADDPAIRFVSGERTVNFRVPAGSQGALFGTDPNSPPIQTGTVAGDIQMVATFRRSGVDVTPSPAPQAMISVAAVAPVITDLSVTRTASGLTVVVRGFSTPRNMTAATLTFTPRSGASTTGPLTFTVDLAAPFTAWYAQETSAQHGSRFQLTLPVTITGDSADVVGLAVQLRNAIGGSNTRNATF